MWMRVALQMLKEKMGEGPGVQSAIAMVERSLADATRDSYTNKLNLFADFLRQTGRTIPAREHDIMVYIGWLHERGGIQESSLQSL